MRLWLVEIRARSAGEWFCPLKVAAFRQTRKLNFASVRVEPLARASGLYFESATPQQIDYTHKRPSELREGDFYQNSSLQHWHVRNLRFHARKCRFLSQIPETCRKGARWTFCKCHNPTCIKVKQFEAARFLSDDALVICRLAISP